MSPALSAVLSCTGEGSEVPAEAGWTAAQGCRLGIHVEEAHCPLIPSRRQVRVFPLADDMLMLHPAQLFHGLKLLGYMPGF